MGSLADAEELGLVSGNINVDNSSMAGEDVESKPRVPKEEEYWPKEESMKVDIVSNAILPNGQFAKKGRGRVHEREILECAKCGKRTNNGRWSLASHIKRVHKVWGDLSQHIRKVPKEEYLPEEVKPSPKRIKMAAPIKYETSETVYHKCQHCGFASPQEVILHRHITNVHGQLQADLYVATQYVGHKSKEGEDGKIEEKIDRIQDIRRDGSVSSGGAGKWKGQNEAVHCKIVKSHKCSQCDFATTTRFNLKRHVRNIHEKVRDLSVSKDERTEEAPKVSAEFLSTGEFLVKRLEDPPEEDEYY